MENVYVIKVKTKPPVSSLYPSERRYSASTVGGLSLVHFGLGALSLLLGSFALSFQGPVLAVACLVPFVTGLLAWRRWYVDRNIAIFFYGSLFSLIAGALCFAATVLDIAAAAERIERATRVDGSGTTGSPRGALLESLRSFREPFRNGTAEPDLAYDGADLEDRSWLDNVTNASLERIRRKVVSVWQDNYQDYSQTKILLTVNVLVASLLEVFWSALSAKIALRGMTNRVPEPSCANANLVAGAKSESEERAPRRKPPPPRPDILDHDRRISETLETLRSVPAPRLPLPESSREFRERVERFLANQATHGIRVGGSYA